MSISCSSNITAIDIPNKKARVSCDISVDSGPTHTVIIENADISTSQKKTEVANIVWYKFLKMYQQQLAEEGIAQELSDLETALNTNIEGRELP